MSGRPRESELRAVRERVEELMLAGLRPAEIRRAMAGAGHPLSPQAVERHCRAVRDGWRARRVDLEAERAEMVAQLSETARQAITRANLYAKSNLGVGYLNVYLKASERIARLRGLDAPARTELSGPGGGPIAFEHPAAALEPAEQAERLRAIALELEARP